MHIVELNNHIPHVRPLTTVEGVSLTKLPNNEILDLLEFGAPSFSQKVMALQDFDPMTHAGTEFVAFCERLEQLERLEGAAIGSQKPKSTGSTLLSVVPVGL
jgi:hypothetical protein